MGPDLIVDRVGTRDSPLVIEVNRVTNTEHEGDIRKFKGVTAQVGTAPHCDDYVDAKLNHRFHRLDAGSNDSRGVIPRQG